MNATYPNLPHSTIPALNIDLATLTSIRTPQTMIKVENRADIRRIIKEAENQATKANSLFVLQLALGEHQVQVLLTSDLLSTPGVTFPQPESPSPPTILGDSDPQLCPHLIYTPSSIYKHVAKALQDYHVLSRLARNPLAHILGYTQHSDNIASHVQGVAVRHVLDNALDALSKADSREERHSRRWHLENYLHLRYREEFKHKDIALQMGYTERHLQRLRRELILEVAELLLA